jgi:L,D-peptidoglycan transpeptidase YkuD (ErfK/YbiS/YcfS/YnhG family)
VLPRSHHWTQGAAHRGVCRRPCRVPWLRAVRFRLIVRLFLCGLGVNPAVAQTDRLDASVKQLIVSLAPTWDSMHGRLWRLKRQGDTWQRVASPVPVLFGKHGLAWGRGELVGEGGALTKVERDGRAPAGVFRLGTIYTYDAALPAGAFYPFHTVGPGDAWVDDVDNPNYNRHVVVNPAHAPPWFARQRMRQGDFAYRWLVEVRHNADPPVPGFGSAIFFHTRRGPDRPSAGCTTMAEGELVTLIRWLRAEAHPRYVCLPEEGYRRYWQVWGLPDPAVLGMSAAGRKNVAVVSPLSDVHFTLWPISNSKAAL